MAVSVVVDNHGRGQVTLRWGAPGLAEQTNPGDNNSATIQKYLEEGTYTITAVDNSDPANTATAPVTLPFPGAPELELSVVDDDPTAESPRRVGRATWDNHGQGPVVLRWDYPGEPPEGTPQAEAGTATHTYLEAHDGIHNVSVTDATNPARAQIVAIQTPDFIPIGG